MLFALRAVPWRPLERVATASTTVRAQLDDSPRVPSEKQIAYAQRLAVQAAKPLPDAATADSGVCSQFIDEMLRELPPSQKQVAYAQTLAGKVGDELPDAALLSAAACSEYIDKMVGGGSGGDGYAATAAPPVNPNLPTDKQLLFACRLAREAQCDLPAEALRSKRDCSNFIEGLQKRKEGDAGAEPLAAGTLERFQDTDIPF